MRSVVLAAAIATITPTLSSPAAAVGYFQRGNDLFQSCDAPASDANHFQKWSLCTGYIAGVADFIEMQRDMAGKGPCSPAAATQGQMRDVVIKYLRENPEKRAEGAALLVTLAITKAFNCS